MPDCTPRLSGLPLAVSRLAVLGVVVLNGWIASAIVVLRDVTLAEYYTGPMWENLTVLTVSGLAAAAIASAVAAALVVRGGRKRSAHALALALASATFSALVFLSVFTPWSTDSILLWPVTLLLAGDIWWVFLLLAAAGFLRFSVLFPRPLTTEDLGRMGKVDAGDSMSRWDRWLKRLWAQLFERRRNGPTERSGTRLIHRWTDRLPEPLRRWARQPVMVDAGRVLTEPRRFWTGVAIMAAIPPAVGLALELVAALEGGPLLVDHPANAVGLLVVIIWGCLVVMAAPMLGVAVLRLGHGLAGEADRRRMRWIVESLNAAVWVLMALAPFIVLRMLGVENPVPRYLPALFGGVLPLIVVTGFAVAIFYDGALEPRLVVRKSTLYGLFGFGLAFLFAITEELVTNHMTAQLGLPDGSGTLVASGVIAVVFGAFHGRFNRKVQGWLDEEGPTPDKDRRTEPDMETDHEDTARGPVDAG